MENWKHILGGLYEPVDKLQGIGEDDGWLIYDKIGRRTCVLKKRELASKELYEKLREMKNPHLPELYRLMEQEGYLWVIEEHIEGSNLSDRLTYEGGAMEEELAVHVLEGLCRCLAPLHRRGIIHRDIKPANIMLDKSGQVKLGMGRPIRNFGAPRGTHLLSSMALARQMPGATSTHWELPCKGCWARSTGDSCSLCCQNAQHLTP